MNKLNKIYAEIGSAWSLLSQFAAVGKYQEAEEIYRTIEALNKLLYLEILKASGNPSESLGGEIASIESLLLSMQESNKETVNRVTQEKEEENRSDYMGMMSRNDILDSMLDDDKPLAPERPKDLPSSPPPLKKEEDDLDSFNMNWST